MTVVTAPLPRESRTKGAPEVLLADSITEISEEHCGSVVVSGSHGGRYPGLVALRCGVRGVVLNDAGIGYERAGIAGLDVLSEAGVPAAAIGNFTARIGDATDAFERGRVTHVNGPAQLLGGRVGMSACEVARTMLTAGPQRPVVVSDGESRHVVRATAPCVWALDSAALVRPSDAGDVVLTGSHGGLVGGDPAQAVKADVLAAVFNDAGVGMDSAGVGRLPALDARNIPGATVDAATARIGDGRSTHTDGVISAVNATAEALGAHPGVPTGVFVDLVLDQLGNRAP